MSKKYTIELSEDLDSMLLSTADLLGTTKADVMRKGLAIINLAAQAKKDGKHFGIAEKTEDLDTEVVGI